MIEEIPEFYFNLELKFVKGTTKNVKIQIIKNIEKIGWGNMSFVREKFSAKFFLFLVLAFLLIHAPILGNYGGYSSFRKLCGFATTG